MYPVASDVGLWVRIPHEGDGVTLSAGRLDGTENERCDPGVKKHLPEKGLEIMVNMVIIISARQISNEKMT